VASTWVAVAAVVVAVALFFFLLFWVRLAADAAATLVRMPQLPNGAWQPVPRGLAIASNIRFAAANIGRSGRAHRCLDQQASG